MDEWIGFLAVALGEDLSSVRLFRGLVAAVLTRLAGASALTLGRWIFFSPSAWTKLGTARVEALELLAHEVAHVAQVRRLGLVRFLWSYLSEYVKHRRTGFGHRQAYLALSAEVEARQMARLCVDAALDSTSQPDIADRSS